MLTLKAYDLVAAGLRKASPHSEPNHPGKEAKVKAWAEAVVSVADELTASGASFDRLRFLAACSPSRSDT